MDRVGVIKKFIKHVQEVSEQADKVSELFPSAADGKVFDAVFRALDGYTNAIALLVGTDEDTINWFIFDNKFGEVGLEAGTSQITKPIKTVEDLIWLIDLQNGEFK